MKSNSLPILMNERQISGKHNSQVSVLKDGLHLQFCSASQISLSNPETQLVLVPARTGFISCSSQEGLWPGHRGYSTPPHNTAGDKEGHTLPGSAWWAVTCESFTSFVHTLCTVAATVHFLTSLLFPGDFFLLSAPNLHLLCLQFSSPATHRGKRRGERVSSTWFGVFWWSTILGNTVPKPWQQPFQILAVQFHSSPTSLMSACTLCTHPPVLVL